MSFKMKMITTLALASLSSFAIAEGSVSLKTGANNLPCSDFHSGNEYCSVVYGGLPTCIPICANGATITISAKGLPSKDLMKGQTTAATNRSQTLPQIQFTIINKLSQKKLAGTTGKNKVGLICGTKECKPWG